MTKEEKWEKLKIMEKEVYQVRKERLILGIKCRNNPHNKFLQKMLENKIKEKDKILLDTARFYNLID